MKTQKQIFQQVRDHLLEQNAQSISLDSCMYRHNGLKCAIGCIITDAEYDTSIEHQGFELEPEGIDNVYSRVCASLGVDTLKTSTYEMLGELQDLHDARRKLSCWRDELNTLEKKYEGTENWNETI